jgi:hypothetical protein
MKRVIKMGSMLITSPSFAALAATGLAILLIGVHGLLHLGVERVYGYNPLA